MAEINKLNRVYLKTAKDGSAEAGHERRLQRLLEIVGEIEFPNRLEKNMIQVFRVFSNPVAMNFIA